LIQAVRGQKMPPLIFLPLRQGLTPRQARAMLKILPLWKNVKDSPAELKERKKAPKERR